MEELLFLSMDKYRVAAEIVDKLRQAGFAAYFAGGCVRDRIMGVKPLDYDIATAASPQKIMALFKRTVPVGIQYGVVLVVEKGIPFEVAAFRRDGIYIDGRHPVNVDFAQSPEQDVKRRDFTINGLLYDPVNGQVLDYVGGKRDIQQGLIRAIGNPEERFAEDKLRMMRAVRFASRYLYQIEAGTLAAIKKLAPAIGEVSLERIRDELDKIIRGRHPGFGLQLLEDTGLLIYVLPEVSALVGVAQPEEFHPEGDVFIHSKIMLDLLDQPSFKLAFAALLHDIGKPRTFVQAERIRFDGHVQLGARMADNICRRLKMSNEQREHITTYIWNHLKFMDVQEMREAKLKRFMQSETFLEELELHRVDCLASHGKLDNWFFCRQKLVEYSQEQLRPVPLISGDDLIELGYKPGPVFKEILNRVADLQLENELMTTDQALTWVKENYTI